MKREIELFFCVLLGVLFLNRRAGRKDSSSESDVEN
jgi:hypothetical protein